MLLIKTEIKGSPIHGVGLFSLEEVRYGELISMIDPIFSKEFTEKEIESLNDVAKEFLRIYSFKSKKNSNKILLLDNERMMNHSDNPNTYFINGYTFCKKDINIGDEITCNYNELNSNEIDFEIKEVFNEEMLVN